MSEQLIATGQLKSSHGIHGEIKVHSYSEEFAHLQKLVHVVLRDKDGHERTAEIEYSKISGKELLMKFKGIDSPEAVKALSGYEIWVPRNEASKLRKGEYYVADLVGCSMVSEGNVLGQVTSAFDGPQALLLEVLAQDGKQYFVPFMEQYVGTVDLEKRTMELKAPWLLS